MKKITAGFVQSLSKPEMANFQRIEDKYQLSADDVAKWSILNNNYEIAIVQYKQALEFSSKTLKHLVTKDGQFMKDINALPGHEVTDSVLKKHSNFVAKVVATDNSMNRDIKKYRKKFDKAYKDYNEFVSEKGLDRK